MPIRAAIIENDAVVNVIVADSLAHPVESHQEVIDAPRGQVEIGWIRQPDGSFAPPAEPAPE